MVTIKDMKMPSSCYSCPFAENVRTNDHGSFCECGILEDYETIVLLEHSKSPNCPLIEYETRKGYWIFKKTAFDKFGNTVECSSCHKKWKTYDEVRWRKENKFCPNCGADMREVEE